MCGKVAGGERSEAVGAQAVTPGAVRCSAWLGARLDSEQTSKKNLEALELAGDDRITGDGKLELSERMELRKTKRLALSRRVANQSQTVATSAWW